VTGPAQPKKRLQQHTGKNKRSGFEQGARDGRKHAERRRRRFERQCRKHEAD
jgi:hypothetical protein